MSSVWFRHFRYVFVAYVHVFLSQVECCFVSWLSPWFCLLCRSGSCHSYHIALPRHGMFVSYDEIGEVLILLVCLRLSGQVPWDHLLSKHVFLRPITAWLTMALQELHEYAHAIQSGNGEERVILVAAEFCRLTRAPPFSALTPSVLTLCRNIWRGFFETMEFLFFKQRCPNERVFY